MYPHTVYLDIARQRTHDLINEATVDRLVRQARQQQPIGNAAEGSAAHRSPIGIVTGRIAQATRPILGASCMVGDRIIANNGRQASAPEHGPA
jgi:hypothetical protein